jgi:hypothetical protein
MAAMSGGGSRPLPLVNWGMAGKDVPRAFIRIGFVAEYLDEGRGIFVSRHIRHLPSQPPTDHQNDRALGEH